VSEASYTAWDDNLYAWPPPEGWYRATDGRWWPAGYGPAGQATASSPATGEAAVPEAGGLDPYDQRTSAIPAGGLAAAASGPVERAEAETRRRVFDELPPIDDVFGGIDPYADDEEAISSPPAVETRERGEPPAEGARRPVGSDGPGAAPPDFPDRGYLLLGPADEEPRPLAANGAAGGPPAAPPPPSSLLGDSGGGNRAAGEAEPAPFDAAATVFAPSPAPPDARAADGDPTGLLAGGATVPPEPSPGPPARADRPGRPPVEEWATATTILGRDDDGATTQLHIEAPRAAERATSPAAVSPGARAGERAGGWGSEADWDDDDGDGGRRSAPPDRDPVPSGGAAFPRDLGGPGDDLSDRSGRSGGYGDVPLGTAPAPRRWWPLVAIGLALLVAAASIGGYFLLRDDNQSASTDDVELAGEGPPGSFASPYPFGKVVVVYYNDEATKEQRRWVIQVLAPVADATQQLVGAGTAEAPSPGEVLALARVRITYQSGPAPGSLSDLRFKAVGAVPGTVFDAAVACPAASPLDEAAQVKVLDSAEGDLCWRIPQAELVTLKLGVEAEAADGTVHMELNAPAGG